MNTTTPVSPKLGSPHLTAPGDIAGHLNRTIEIYGADLTCLWPQTAELLRQLDDALTTDPAGGHDHFVADATTTIDAVQRRALHHLARSCGAMLPDASGAWPAHLGQPARCRPPTGIETLVIRMAAVDRSPRHACLIGALEAGASTIELANTETGTLGTTADRSLAVPGDRDSRPRDITLPSWVPLAAIRNLARSGGRWLLHGSRSHDPDKRNSTVQMAVRQLLNQTGLADVRTLTAKSILRGSMQRLALSGATGWADVLAATGHHNPEVTNELLALHRDW